MIKIKLFSEEGLAAFLIDGKWGFISIDGRVVINPIYSNADNFVNGLAGVDTVEKLNSFG